MIIKPIITKAISENEAREIFGNKFISTSEAATAWGKKENNVEYEINNFSREDLELAAEQNKNSRNFYLVPTIGINGLEAKAVWTGKIPANSKTTRKKYWLIDFSTLNQGETITSYREIENSLKSGKEEALTIIESLEILTTIKITRSINFSSQMKTFFISDEQKNKDNALAFSTFTENNKNNVVVMVIPKNEFLMGGYVDDGLVYFLSGDSLENIQMIPAGFKTGAKREDFIFKTISSP
ncbi:MAG: hypothetical protein WCK37_04480 [Candidatus Falkowbacteria bacterium]